MFEGKGIGESLLFKFRQGPTRRLFPKNGRIIQIVEGDGWEESGNAHD